MSDSANYRLNASQQRVWQASVPKPERRDGGQAKIARALEQACGNQTGSWKNTLTKFFKGDKDGLERVFEDAKALEILAEVYDATPEQLRAHLATALGAAAGDGPFDLRIPGFEDLGVVPILDGFYPPELGTAQWSMPTLGLVRSQGGGKLELGPFVDVARRKPRDTPISIVFVGEPGLGRTPLLRALAAELRRRRVPVVAASERPARPNSVVVQDDLDRLPRQARTRLMMTIGETNATLITTTSSPDPLEDLPRERVIIQLRPSRTWWALGYLEHLERLWNERAHPVDLEPLREWLEDDPYTSALTSRVDTLGILARHAMEGGQFPIRHADILRLSIQRWARLLRQRGHGPAALTLEQCGPGALGTAAVEAIRSGTEDFSIQALGRALIEQAHGVAGDDRVPWSALGSEGMLAVIEGLIEIGMLHREGMRLRIAQVAVFNAALGRALSRHLDDATIVRDIVLDPSLHDALVVAAEELGDVTPLLTTIEAQPVEVRCMAFVALTRLLSVDQDPSDSRQLDLVFRKCLRWWAYWPSPRLTMNLPIGGGYRPQQSRPDFERVANLSPIVVMGLASKRHQKILSSLSLEDVHQAPLDESILEYLDLMGRGTPSALDVRITLLLGAPYQSEVILDAASWRWLPPFAKDQPTRKRSIDGEDYQFWWRMVGAPRLQRQKDGPARIAGTTEGMSITSAMFVPPRGTEIWRGALLGRIQTKDPGAMAAFRDAVLFTLAHGSKANHDALLSLWKEIPGRLRDPLREAVSAAIPEPPWHYTEEEWTTWLLQHLVLDPDQRRTLWAAWTEVPVLHLQRIPWRSFYATGVPVTEILGWAMETLPEDDDPVVEPLPVDGEHPPGFAFVQHDDVPSPQETILEYFIEGDDIEALLALRQTEDYDDLRTEAWHRLRAVVLKQERPTIFEVAERMSGDDRVSLLVNLWPCSGEEAVWHGFAESARDLPERLVRQVQADCATNDDAAGWVRTKAALALIDTLTGPRQEEPSTFMRELRDVHGPWVPTDASVENVRAQIAPALTGLLDGIAVTLMQARALERPRIGELVRYVFEAENLGRQISEEAQPLWWVLAGYELGEDILLAKLERAHARIDDESLITDRLAVLGRQDELRPIMLRAAVHPAFRDLVANFVARLTIPSHMEEAHAILDDLPLVDDAQTPATCLTTWLTWWSEVDVGAALRWLRETTAEHGPSVRRSWWQRMTIILPPGEERAEAVAEWSSIGSAKP